jgi:hypothetical protein
MRHSCKREATSQVYVKACRCTLQGSCVALRFWNRLLQTASPEVLSGQKSNLGQICREIVEKVLSHPWALGAPRPRYGLESIAHPSGVPIVDRADALRCERPVVVYTGSANRVDSVGRRKPRWAFSDYRALRNPSVLPPSSATLFT